MKKPFFRPDPSLVLLPLLFLRTEPWDLALFLFSVLLHESGHLFCIRLFGYKCQGLSFSLLGAKIRLSDPFIPYKKEIFIYLSGPLLNLFACIPTLFLLRAHFTREGVFFFFCNILLALFNLLPLPGLDGEGALCALLSLFLAPDRRDEKMRKIRSLFLFLLFLFSLYLLFTAKNPSLFILSLGLGENKQKKATKIS